MQTPKEQEHDIDLAGLGDSLAALRLCDASALEAMRRSLGQHGQLTALRAFAGDGRLEVIDGFKRVRAARALGWRTMRAEVAEVDAVGAKLELMALHERRGLTELEEGWLIRSLYRDHGLSQPVIAARLGRHKSWVFRRLMLVEALDPVVQADVRLGLVMPRAAVAVSQLPRGNQHDLSGLVIRRGLTVRQTELFVAELLDLDGDAARAQQIARRLEDPAPGAPSSRRARCWARASSSDRSSSSATSSSVCRTVSPRRITTPAAACWLPRGNWLTATAARGMTRPRRTSACTAGSRASTSIRRRKTQLL